MHKSVKKIIVVFSHVLPATWLKKLSVRQQRLFWVGVSTVFLIGIPLLVWSFLTVRGVEAAWFDENYLYRQVANITNSNSTALTDFQVSLTVDTATLISAGKMRRDCNDIRITDQGGNLLPFWVEEGSADCNSASTKIWAKAPSIATSGASLFFYYGNQQAASQSSGLKTFDFFDDFDKGQLDNSKWGVTGATSYSGGNLNITTGSVYTQNTVAGQPNEKVEARLQWTNNSGNWGGISIANAQSTQTTNAGSNKLAYMMRGTTTRGVVGYAADGTAASYNITSGTSQFTSSDNTSYILGYAVSPTNVIFYNNRTQTNSYSGTWTAPYYIYLGYHLGSAGSTSDIQDTSVDWVLSRKYAATEPTVSFGTEENSPSPVAYWAFDEGTGNVASSSASTKLTASLFGGTAWLPESQCVAGKCLQFDGTNDYVTVANNSVINVGTGNFTVGAWVRLNGTSNYRVINKWDQSMTIGWILDVNTNDGSSNFPGYLRFKISDGTNISNVSADGSLGDGKWHYITVSVTAVSSTGIKLYVDGRQIGSSGSSTAVTGSLTNTTILGMGVIPSVTGSFYKGFLDEVKVYPFALSAAQVKANFVSRGSLIGSGAVLGATQNNVLSNGLVGYWKMDEASWNGTSGEVIDSSGNGNNATTVNGTEATPSAKFGNAGYFAGTGQNMTFSRSTSIQGIATAGTIATWVKYTALDSAFHAIVDIASTGNNGLILFANDGTNHPKLQYGTGSSTVNAIATRTFATDTWYHVVGTWDGSGGKIYVNGTLEATNSNIPSITVSSGTAYIGANVGTLRFMNGNLDDTRVYNRALSLMEVAQLYNFAPGPVGYWNFEEGQGNVVNDSSTYGNNGAWVGGSATKWVSGKYGKGGNFSGVVNETVAIGSQTNFNFERTNSFSIGAWVNKTGSVAYLPIFNKTLNNVSQAGYIFTVRDTGVLRTQLINTTTPSNYIDVLGTVKVNDGKWHYVAMNYDGTSLANGVTFYVDGVKDTASILTDTLSGTLLNSLTPYIGSRNNTDLWGIGKLDEVRVYNYMRSAKQIISDMQAGAPPVTASGKNTIGYWDFDDGFGNVASNSGSVGSALNASLYGFNVPPSVASGWMNDGKFGKALQFDAVDDLVRVPDNSAMDFGANQDFSYTLWLRRVNDSTARFVISKGAAGTADVGYSFVLSSGITPLLELSKAGESSRLVVTATKNITDTGWHHLALVYNRSGNGVIYMDGNVIGSGDISSYASADLSNSRPFTIGTNSSGLMSSAFPGAIDEVKLYNYALTAQDVKTEYNHGSSLVLGAAGMSSTGVASNSAGAYYCVPGDTSQSCSPVGEWLMEEGRGNVVNDTSGNGMSGTLTNTPVWARGKVGGALDFTATIPYVSFGANKVGPKASGASAVTMSAWVNATGYPSARGRIFSAYDNGANTGFALSYNTTNIEVGGRAALADSFINTTVAAPVLNGWHYLTGILDFANNKIYIYIDGVLAKTTTVSFGSTTYVQGTGTSIDVINLPPGEHLASFIDQVRVYDYARSQAQIAYEYNQGKPVAYYDFDECEGSTAHEYYNSTSSGTIQIGSLGSQASLGTCAASAATAWYNGRSGKFNYSLNFDGTDDYVSIPTGGTFPIYSTTNPYSVSFWVNAASGQIAKRIFAEASAASSNPVFLLATGIASSNKLNVFLRGDSGGLPISNRLSTSTVFDSTWHHVVWTDLAGAAKLYVDGRLDATDYSYTPLTTTLNRTAIGALLQSSPSTFFAGQIDDVQIFNYVLTPVQIKTLYNQNSAVRFGPLTGAP